MDVGHPGPIVVGGPWLQKSKFLAKKKFNNRK